MSDQTYEENTVLCGCLEHVPFPDDIEKIEISCPKCGKDITVTYLNLLHPERDRVDDIVCELVLSWFSNPSLIKKLYKDHLSETAKNLPENKSVQAVDFSGPYDITTEKGFVQYYQRAGHPRFKSLSYGHHRTLANSIDIFKISIKGGRDYYIANFSMPYHADAAPGVLEVIDLNMRFLMRFTFENSHWALLDGKLISIKPFSSPYTKGHIIFSKKKLAKIREQFGDKVADAMEQLAKKKYPKPKAPKDFSSAQYRKELHYIGITDASKQNEIMKALEEGCFIATAAFGSYDHPAVKIFREFRDVYLASNSLGKILINLYYRFGPFLSRLVTRNIFLKNASRCILEKIASIIRKQLLVKRILAGSSKL